MSKSCRSVPLRRSLVSVLVPLCLVPAIGARAAWEAVPEVTLGVDADDNTRLDDEAGQERTSRTFLDAAIGLASFTERSSLTFAPRLVTDAYADSADKELEADDRYLYATGRRDWLSVGTGFRLDYAQESILSAELEEATPDDPDVDDPDDEVDTGRLVFFNDEREQLLLRGDLDFRLSERNAFNIQAQRRSVDYSGSGQTSIASRRSDFDDERVSLGVTRRVDDRNVVSARVFVSNYQATRNDNETDSVGVEGRFSRPVSRTWNFNLRAGVQRSDYDFLDLTTLQRVDNADTNYTLGAGLRRRAERSVANFDLLHTVNPSASGFLVVRDEVRGYLERELSPRFGMRLGGRLSRTNTVDDVDREDERDYARFELGFEWAIARTMFLEFGYDFTRQEFTIDNGDDSSSNALFVGVTYRGMSRRTP
jgi:opacity protein-like surface antigen